MIGSIIGVGVFGLPYAFAQSGLVIGLLELLLIGGLLLFLQLMFAEIVVQTDGDHRIVGYVQQYLGKGWGKIAFIAVSCGVWGAMTAYIIVGGKFFSLLLSPILGGQDFVYSIIIAVVAAIFIYRGIGFVSKFEVVIVLALIFLFIFIVSLSFPNIQISNFFTFHPTNAFVPYGVILFSMAGLGVVPEMRAVLGMKQERRLGHAILTAMAVIALLYSVFAISVLGVSGSGTSQAAFDGLLPHLAPAAGIVASLLGALTILSIFILLGIQLKNTLIFDFRLREKTSWFLVVSVPIFLYLIGVRELIGLIGFVGSVFTGILGILIVLSYLQMRKSPICRKHTCVLFPKPLAWMIVVLFAGGSLLQIFTVLF